MGTVSAKAVEDSLRQCMDPEIPINIVDMGLIYGIDVDNADNVNVKMTMTTRGCPLHDTLVQDTTRYIKKVPGVNDVKVDVVWEPAWTMDRMSKEARESLKGMGAGGSTPAPIDYERAMPQGTGKLSQQEDGALALINEHEQAFMVNQAIVDFWKSCNGQRKITELVGLFAKSTGYERGQVEKEVMQLIEQLRGGGLITIPGAADAPNVDLKLGTPK